MTRPHLHRSSITLALGATLLLALITVPGRVDEWSPGAYSTFEHGWPLVFLRRHTIQSPFSTTLFASRRQAQSQLPMLGIPWLSLANWQLWQADRSQFSALSLIFDCVIVALVLAAIVACHEFRRRRRNRTLSFRLIDVLVLATLICIALGWIAHLKQASERERTITRRFVNVPGPFVSDVQCVAPVWMKALVGERWMPDFTWRTATVYVHLMDVKDAHRMCDEVRELVYLRKLVLSGSFGGGSHFPFGTLTTVSQLESLQLEGPPRLDAHDIHELSQLAGLHKIAISPKSMIASDLHQQLQSSLPNCEIVDADVDW